MGGPPATAQYAHANLTLTLTLSPTLTLPLTLTLTPGELKWVAGRSGKAGPTPFKELRPPTLQALHHTATVCGEEVYVIGCAPGSSGLSLSILHTPSLSWSEPPNADDLLEFAPRVRSGHSAVLLPSGGGIVVLGGLRSDTGPARPMSAGGAGGVHSADPAAVCRDIGSRPQSSAAAGRLG